MDSARLRTLRCNITGVGHSMTIQRKNFQGMRLPILGVVFGLSAAVLGGCVVEPLPARRVYEAPPPPQAYSEPVDAQVQASDAPPPLPEYDQPPCPEAGYLWTPGYWGYGGGGYYWVPGTWVQPPQVGVLWTPGYWGFVGGMYAFHAGYWGPHIGFYGGVNYGYGYGGVGFAGGRWVGNSFAYNRAVNNVNVTVIHNTYNETVINNRTVNRVSYNGGPHGVAAAPNAQERAYAQDRHVAPTPMQRQHVQEAGRDPALFERANGGHPAIAATPRAAAFNGPGVVRARGAGTAPAGAAPNAGHMPPNGAAHPNGAYPQAGAHPQPGIRQQQSGMHPQPGTRPQQKARAQAGGPKSNPQHPKRQENTKRESEGGNKPR